MKEVLLVRTRAHKKVAATPLYPRLHKDIGRQTLSLQKKTMSRGSQDEHTG